MKTSISALTLAAALGALPTVAAAQLAFNAGVVTDYRYRGISQSRKEPALQGGADYAHASGLYAGVWASSIRWLEDLGTNGDVEIDVYGGYKGVLVKDLLSFDVGVLTYVYPSNKLKRITGADADTTEIYGALTYGPATLKYSHAVTDTFGNPDSKNSYYVDLTAAFDVGGFNVTPHVGYQHIDGPNDKPGSYADLSLTFSKDFNGFVPSVAIVANRSVDGAFYSSPQGKKLASAGVVVGFKYNFSF